MLRKSLMITLIVFSVVITNGQSLSKKLDTDIHSFKTLNVNPSIYVVIDSIHHEIQSGTADEIKSKWLEKTIVMKDKKTEQIYGNKNGAVFMYIKPEYADVVLEKIKDGKDSED